MFSAHISITCHISSIFKFNLLHATDFHLHNKISRNIVSMNPIEETFRLMYICTDIWVLWITTW